MDYNQETYICRPYAYANIKYPPFPVQFGAGHTLIQCLCAWIHSHIHAIYNIYLFFFSVQFGAGRFLLLSICEAHQQLISAHVRSLSLLYTSGWCSLLHPPAYTERALQHNSISWELYLILRFGHSCFRIDRHVRMCGNICAFLYIYIYIYIYAKYSLVMTVCLTSAWCSSTRALARVCQNAF